MIASAPLRTPGVGAACAILTTTDQQAATTYRDGGTGWTVIEVVGHLRDFDEVFLMRARLMVEQERPELPFPDPDQTVLQRGYNGRQLTAVYEEWEQRRAELLGYLRQLSESDWDRVGLHPTRGDFALNTHLFLHVWHDTNHLEQIANILAARAPGS
jgi:hypothetical protein